MTSRWFILLACLSSPWFPTQLHGAAASSARIAPPPGIAIAAEDRAVVEEGVSQLQLQTTQLRVSLRGNPQLEPLLPDVEIFDKAVRWALTHDEFYRSNEVGIARALLRHGMERAKQLQAGQAPWLNATGLVVRGYISKLDGSVQPYGLVVPASFATRPEKPHRLDVWLHGRDNHLTELKFISDRLKSHGEFAPEETFVLHPYGRYCNAFKFAGEVDVFEALEHARKSYPIDGSRLAVRGFSMGGAGCWHLAAHHSGFWAGAAPGAGFAETADYTKVLAKDPKPAWFEQELWHLYDATDYAANLFNCPTLAYSGERDKQKQAADVMARAMKKEGLELTHLIGPGVEHKYEPNTKRELARRFDEVMAGGQAAFPSEVRFPTWTLRYNRMHWVTVDALEEHWKRARVNARLTAAGFVVTTTNVTALTLALPPTFNSLSTPLEISIDGQALKTKSAQQKSNVVHLKRNRDRWSLASTAIAPGLRKRHGLQGPIDDAFMESFIMVRPTGQPLNAAVGRWTQTELASATNEWRAQFRGDVRVKDDSDITESDIAANNVILWGDPQSNKLLAKLIEKLPLRWTNKEVQLDKHTFPSGQCVPAFIYPNPLNPDRYIVLNSGFTFWKEGSASNARQTPKLPDFALLDITDLPNDRANNGILAAGFFDESWETKEP